MVAPSNAPEDVALFCRLLNLEPGRRFVVQPAEEGAALQFPLPQPCTVGRLVEKHLDITRTPRRSFFELAALLSPDQREREKLAEFASAPGQEELYAYCHRPRRTTLEATSCSLAAAMKPTTSTSGASGRSLSPGASCPSSRPFPATRTRRFTSNTESSKTSRCFGIWCVAAPGSIWPGAPRRFPTPWPPPCAPRSSPKAPCRKARRPASWRRWSGPGASRPRPGPELGADGKRSCGRIFGYQFGPEHLSILLRIPGTNCSIFPLPRPIGSQGRQGPLPLPLPEASGSPGTRRLIRRSVD
ncbi:NADPH-dependent diflavin oxidoreductase 1 isoform X3 [Podarcis lilfordi]|uniref:NADPH-dependent diflavin oxidoreductase 1 isoform X3 n=1 Tax=Podarcis lilfordi TaxID=74358 RepID=A0AA35LDW7_9SAUR|nr:NADPH-dependent diflavin oxidoreductase 1 isoform X3 [Podarcis lilfordi]